jgi:large subunit ribosomal protein L4
MSIPVLNPEGVLAGEAAFQGPVAEQEIKPHLIHETVVSELGQRRAGTHSTKNRGEVRGGGRKPWRQKGTGRARQGSNRAPHWRGGGVTFGPTPRSHGGKVNRKVRAQAFRAALRAHADRGSLAVMDPTGWGTPSSKRAAAYLYQAPEGIAPRPLLVVVDDPDAVVGLSFRNLEDVYVLAASDVEVVDLMAGRSLLIERAVWERFTGSELSVIEVAATPKPLPIRTAPPAPKPTARKVEDEKPKRIRKKAAEEPTEEPAAEETEAAEVADEAPEVTEVEAPVAVAEEPSAEAVVETPKRTRKKAAPAEDAPADEAPVDEPPAEEKPKGTRKKAEPADEAPAEEPATEEKPKRTRKKAEPAAEAEKSDEAPAAGEAEE